MQDYIEFAQKNGVILKGHGACQFCGAPTQRGIHECLEVFNMGFEGVDLSNPSNHKYRFFIVDAHTLQHPEIHGRWNNHFHLTRLHLIFEYKLKWSYFLSPKLSDHLNTYKSKHPNEYLSPPPPGNRGTINSLVVQQRPSSPEETKQLVLEWAQEVYHMWQNHHRTVDKIARSFLG